MSNVPTFLESDPLPTLSCIGTVSQVYECNVGASGLYITQPIQIEGIGGSPKKKIFMVYRPEWLVDGFDPRILKADPDTRNSLTFVYKKNIVEAPGANLSLLQGLAGNQARFEELFTLFYAAELAGDMLDGGNAVCAVLKDFFTGSDVQFGYNLTQERKKTDLINAEGKNEYLRTDNYEIGGYWWVTEKGVASRRRLAESSAREAVKLSQKDGVPVGPRFQVAFDEGQPF